MWLSAYPEKSFGEGKIHVVIGHGAEQVKTALGHYDLNWVVQKEQLFLLGTGHAVQQALSGCQGADVVLVLYGDVPLIHSSSLQSLLAASNGRAGQPYERLGLLTINLANPSGYGRIIRDGFGDVFRPSGCQQRRASGAADHQSPIEDKDAIVTRTAGCQRSQYRHYGHSGQPGESLDQQPEKRQCPA